MAISLSSWRRRVAKEQFPLARSRAQRLSTADLYSTCEFGLAGIGEALSLWRRGQGTPALDEAERNLLGVLEVVRELRARS